MIRLDVTQYSDKVFTQHPTGHNPATRVLACEASDIGLWKFDYLYTDSSDVGLALVDSVNGDVTRWVLKETLRHPDSKDILYWILQPTIETLRDDPNLEHYELRIYND